VIQPILERGMRYIAAFADPDANGVRTLLCASMEITRAYATTVF
jgi:hypothetical protein